MKLTSKCEYALLTIMTLTKNYYENNNVYVPTKRVAKHNDIPKEYLEKIVSSLTKSGYLESQLGPKGGIRLKKDPKEVSVADIVRLIDGHIAPVTSVSEFRYKSSPVEKSKSLLFLFKRLRDIEDKILDNTKFSDLI